MLDLLLKNVKLPEGRIVDISVAGGIVTHAGAGGEAAGVIDCSGLLVLPGGVDMHVHMRGGSRESYKEDWGTGSRAALAGGVTFVVDQPNTDPPLTTVQAFQARVREAQRDSLCHFAVNAGAVPGAPLTDLWKAGAMAFGEIFLAPSTGAAGVPPRGMKGLLADIHALGAPATIHAEEVTGEPGIDITSHGESRSSAGEIAAVGMVKGIVPGGMQLHFCHLSTAGAVAASAPHSSEATPHHLLLSLDDFGPEDARGKVNPPLRSAAERDGLFAVWDRITVLASDHAPHTVSEKSGEFSRAPAGMPGIETMIPLMVPKVLSGETTLASLIAKTSANPCRVLGIPAPGFSKGDRADFALFPGEATVIHARDLHSRCGWTPYEGKRAVFPSLVIMGGEVVVDDGDITRWNPRWFPGRGYHP
ncbi:MAG TPA: amidohydrolase family protein [Methanomicrobiales archaeon]|nr:amidohydrolase family protein [Methanomicrobiales archaeon]